mmetsp:Transcript_29702/g.57106  ORF Transcript_29702/g.57106 Transcript_29702/m.57106 type:complete len:663 (+) Transcript_29702:274-2262(+)
MPQNDEGVNRTRGTTRNISKHVVKSDKHPWISRLFCLGRRAGLRDAGEPEEVSFVDKKANAIPAGTPSSLDMERRAKRLSSLKLEIGINTGMRGKASSRVLMGAQNDDESKSPAVDLDILASLPHYPRSTSKTRLVSDLDSFGIPGGWWASALQLREEGSPDLGRWEDTPYSELSSTASVEQEGEGDGDEASQGAGAAHRATLLDAVVKSTSFLETTILNQELVHAPARDNLLSSKSESEQEGGANTEPLKEDAPASGPKSGSSHTSISTWTLSSDEHVTSSKVKSNVEVARRNRSKASRKVLTAPAPNPPISNGRRVDHRERGKGQQQDSLEAPYQGSSMQVLEASNHQPSSGTDSFKSPNSRQSLSTKAPIKPTIPDLALPLHKLPYKEHQGVVQRTQDPRTNDAHASPYSDTDSSSNTGSKMHPADEYISPPKPSRVLETTAKQTTLMGGDKQHTRRNPSRKLGEKSRGKHRKAPEAGARPTSARAGGWGVQGGALGNEDSRRRATLSEAELSRKVRSESGQSKPVAADAPSEPRRSKRAPSGNTGSSKEVLRKREADSSTEEESISAVSQGRPQQLQDSVSFGLCQVYDPEEVAGDDYACGINPVSAPAEVFSHIGLWAKYFTSTASIDRAAVNELPENPPDMMPRDFYLTEKKSWQR